MLSNDGGGGLQPTQDPTNNQKPQKRRRHKKPVQPSDVDGQTELKQWVVKEVLVTPDNQSQPQQQTMSKRSDASKKDAQKRNQDLEHQPLNINSSDFDPKAAKNLTQEGDNQRGARGGQRGGQRGERNGLKGERGARGRGHGPNYQQPSHNGQTNWDEPLPGLRGNANRRGGRDNNRGTEPRYQNKIQAEVIPQANFKPSTQIEETKQGDQNRANTAQPKNGRNKRQRDPDFFEERKRDKNLENASTKLVMEQKVQNLEIPSELDPSQIHSKRNKQNLNLKNLGSAAKYLDNSEEFKNDAPEKLQFFKKNNPNLKDRAKIKYNYKDFLSQFGHLSEQCVFFVQSLSTGNQECIICQNQIYQRSATWNCQQCCQPFHLGCIKRWIQKLNKSLEQNIRDQADEERKDHQPAQTEDESSDEDVEIDDNMAKKMLAFYSWTCPNCNFAYAENKMPKYACYCGNFEEPPFDPLMLAHSCGEYCDKPRNKDCTHDRCDVLCHPGSCPPCNISVPAECYCGKQTQRVPCQVSKRTKFTCAQSCLKKQNCGVHECQQTCHEGPCSPCDLVITQTCFCGKKEQQFTCGTPAPSCKNVCGKELDCEKHSCEKCCHSGQCPPCGRDPSRVLYCPSGHNKIEKLIGRQRTSCTEPIPVCQSLCERFLPCGIHQCIKTCHTDDCMRCDKLVEKKCPCGKSVQRLTCYQINYPLSKRELFMTSKEIALIDSFKCNKPCNKHKSCNRHKCTEVCCSANRDLGRAGDPEAKHLCTIVCDKKLSCGTHECTDFCHLGFCKPCKWVSIKPVFCPCGIAKLDPPVKCGQPPPNCGGPCKQILDCKHPCSLKCHQGNCPPCLQMITRLCNCGKELKSNVYCKMGSYNCGQICETQLECGHKCQKICHEPGKCIISRENLLEKGCGQRCGKERAECGHRCQSTCHPEQQCPSTPCEAEIRIYCKCKQRWVVALCKSVTDRPPIDCDARCWKKSRDEKIASAFSSQQDFDKNKGNIKFEYYPEDAIQFSLENMLWAKKVESQLTYIVLNQSTKSYTGMSAQKRQFLSLLVYEHFHLDMCNYGGQGQKKTTDVFWRENCKIPEIMCSEIADLINKGISEVRFESDKTTIFEASIYISNVPGGHSIDDLKKFLSNFKNEMYTEKGKQMGQFTVHFYSRARAKDAMSFIQNTPNQFSNCEMVCHKKEIGTLGTVEEESKMMKKPKKGMEDDDGFMSVVRK